MFYLIHAWGVPGGGRRGGMNVRRAVLATLSALCWTAAVVVGGLAVAAFFGGGYACQNGQRRVCEPNTWLLVGGIALAILLGVAGALLYQPRRKRPPPRVPWEYHD